jgi:flagellar motility protein MotE (MotC chaperone)
LTQLQANVGTESASKSEAEEVDNKKLLDQKRRDLSNMSARNAAAIVEKMAEDEAVNLMKGMGSDARSSILAKMDPAKAARIMELMGGQ